MYVNNFKRRWLVPRFILFFLLAIFAFGLVIMLLWNWLMPVLFSLPQINYFQALGILLFSKLLFGFYRHSASWAYHRERCEHWRKKYEEKYEKPEATA